MKRYSTISLIKGIWDQLPKNNKIKILINFALILLSSTLEIISLSVIYPVLSIATDAQQLNNPIILKLTTALNIQQERHVLILISLFLIFSVILSSASKIFSLKYSIILTQKIGAGLTSKALGKFLYQDYEIHINRNSSEVISTINRNLDGVISGIEAVLMIITNAFICSSILLTLAVINFKITFLIIFFYITAYLILSTNSKRILVSNSKEIVGIQPLRENYLYESLNAIREITLSNLQNFYLCNFRYHDEKLRNKIGLNSYLTSSFRFYLEGLTLILIAFVILVLTLNSKFPSLALLGLFAVGAQKLLPSMQSIFRYWSTFRSKKFQIIESLKILNEKINIVTNSTNFKFKQKISLVDMSYKYKGSNKYIFKNVSFSINKGECIGIKGTTGSGKSTLIDIIMSLIKPSNGKLLVDGNEIHSSKNTKLRQGWRNRISHVPQNIFMSDGTFAQNIAFGIEQSEINFVRVKKSAELAQISEYILSTDLGYGTNIGEKGIKLSGGQKQRIAIARALYKKSDLLIMDEATSALDNQTEDNIMKTINSLKGEITIIIIAHRVRTLKDCDRVIEIEGGKILEIN